MRLYTCVGGVGIILTCLIAYVVGNNDLVCSLVGLSSPPCIRV